MSDMPEKLASTYEQSQKYVQTAQEKVKKANDITNDVLKTANQARDDLEAAKEALGAAHDEILGMVRDVGDIVKAIQGGDIPGIAVAVKKTVDIVTQAVPKYGAAVSTVSSKAEGYHQAVSRNEDALKSF